MEMELERLIELILVMRMLERLSGASVSGEVTIRIEAEGIKYELPKPNLIVLRPEIVAVTPLDAEYSVVEGDIVENYANASVVNIDTIMQGVELLGDTILVGGSVEGVTLIGEVSELTS
jgi:hypothetical protein